MSPKTDIDPKTFDIVEMHAEARAKDLLEALAALRKLDLNGLTAVRAALRKNDEKPITQDVARYRRCLRESIGRVKIR